MLKIDKNQQETQSKLISINSLFKFYSILRKK